MKEINENISDNIIKNKNTKLKYLVLLHILLVFYSLCGVFSKLASRYEFLSLNFILFYGISIFILGIYAVLWQQILKHFSLTTAFMNKAVTIIWGVIWGMILFNESIKLNMIIGTIVVLIGICLVVKSDE